MGPAAGTLEKDGNLVSGDTLFVNSCGRVDLPGSDPEAMYHSLNRTLRKFLRRQRKYRYAAPEGGVLRSPTMHSLIYDIKSAGLVVGLLLPGSYKEFDIANARSCFLLGVAVAQGKPVLVMLQEPVTSGPADLSMLAQQFGSVPTMIARSTNCGRVILYSSIICCVSINSGVIGRNAALLGRNSLPEIVRNRTSRDAPNIRQS